MPDDLFSYADQTQPKVVPEEPSAALFPDAGPPPLQECSGHCVWIEFGLATAEHGCEMCRAQTCVQAEYTPFSETVRAVFGHAHEPVDDDQSVT